MLKKILYKLTTLSKLDASIEHTKHLAARNLIEINRKRESEILENIQKSEFKVYSQWGDDGIIQFLVNFLNIQNKSFIEFGVENYTEANTRFLLMNNNWRGLIFDGSKKNIDHIHNDPLYWKYNITANCSFITRENINQLIIDNGFNGNIGILHIDIDGNDYWIWDSITAVKADIVIMEYNSLWGGKETFSTPYKPDFVRSNAHFSNVYYGASLAALVELGTRKGYDFVGCNSAGNNAYFVKHELVKNLKVLTAEEGFVESSFRESRDKDGKLNFFSKEKQLQQLKGLEVIDTRTGKTVIL